MKVLKMKNRKFSITTKLLLLVIGLQFVTVAINTYFNEKHERAQYIKQVDERLKLVVHSSNEFILQNYHDKILNKDSIKNEEYIKVMMTLSSLAKKANIQYVYSFIKRKDDVLVSSTSVTEEDFENKKYESFFEKYDTVSKQLFNSFEDKKLFFEETHDKYGYVRTVIIPFKNKYGETYIIGADIEIKALETAIMENRKNIIIISLIVFAISAFIYLTLSNIIMRRIPIIRNGLEEFFDYVNSKRDDVTPIKMSGNDELCDMADMINHNINLIATNIKKDNELINEIASISNEVKNGAFSNRIEKDGNNPALNQVKVLINDVLMNTQQVMLDILNVLKEFSKQNYNSKLGNYKLDGEMGKLVEEINNFGKVISDYMLNSAYDALNLKKDSAFTNEIMFKLTNQFNIYLKEINDLQGTTENLYRYNLKSLQKLENTLKETSYADTIINKTANELKLLVNGTFSDKETNERNIKISEMLEDIQHSLMMITKYTNDFKTINQQSVKAFEVLNGQYSEFEEQISEGNNSIDQLQKVSSNLNELSTKMRKYIENSEFNGKENIIMLMNYSEK